MRLCEVIKTGSEVTVDLDNNLLTDHSTGKTYKLQDIGDVSGRPVARCRLGSTQGAERGRGRSAARC